MPNLAVTSSIGDDGQPVVALSGEVDVAAAEAIASATRAALSEGSAHLLTFDLAGVTFLDSSGLGALVAARNSVRAKGARVALTNVPRAAARVIEIAGLADTLGLAGASEAMDSTG